MRRNARVSSTREKLHALYERARRDDPAALARLLRVATAELATWLSRRLSTSCGNVVELHEIAVEAMEEAVLRIHRIPSWEGAWAYARKVATRAAKRRRSKRRNDRCSHWELLDVSDPCSGAARSRTELEDAVMGEALRMSIDDLRILISMFRGVPPLDELSRELNVSIRTLTRRRRYLRRRILRTLQNP